MFEGLASADKDPRKSLHVGDVALPELAPDEAYVAVMASSINFNTVWTSIFEPLPTFGFLDRLGRRASGGRATPSTTTWSAPTPRASCCAPARLVRNWKPGDQVTVHCNYVDDQDPSAHDDSMLAANQRIWGFESNFGGLADIAVVKANQLMPKPAHLSWEEAAVNALCNSTAYRMLVSRNGAADEAGRPGARLGGQRAASAASPCSTCSTAGGIPVGVVSSPDKVALLHDLGVEAVIDRQAAGYRFWADEHTQDESEWRRFGKDIRALVGEDPDIVFEHPGRQTMGASVFVVQAGGHGRHLRGDLGLHDRVRQPAPLDEAEDDQGLALRQLPGGVGREPAGGARARSSHRSRPSTRLTEVGEAAYQVHHNLHEGKIGVLCLAPAEGSGSTTRSCGPRSARTGSRCSGGHGA